jgi:hypothetical protein
MVRLTGGGYGSDKHVEARKGKQEPVTHKANVEGVGQVGLQHAFKPKPMLEGKGYEPSKMGPTGIANATKGPQGAGPGGMGRTIYKSGSQAPTPVAREMEPGRGFDERPNLKNRYRRQ